MVEMLCKDAEVNHKNKEGASALARAIYQENTSIIELLVENGGKNTGPIARLDEEKTNIHIYVRRIQFREEK